MTSLELANNKFHFSPNGLTIKGDPTFEEWQQCGEQLYYVQGAIQWWIGDWLNYGEQRWGEMYAQALNETDYQKGSLRNLKSIAGRIDKSRRRDNLSFAHHAEVVSLPESEQEILLDKATNEGLTSFELRQEAQARKNDKQPDYNFLVDKIIHLIQRLPTDKIQLIRDFLETI